MRTSRISSPNMMTLRLWRKAKGSKAIEAPFRLLSIISPQVRYWLIFMKAFYRIARRAAVVERFQGVLVL